ncbi:cytidine deaminase [Gillisia sp. M10.2A]|uniref:Cytidine deaminase n=1 Tax=Gillisia lutea TaxID=2909668 RepID=A0ABS9EH93_9FLAO|nr:cytidine deaminase [Gillisia lutea]MCF4102221.1 cytidine deaminase [Gillisia lutea]
MKSITITSTLEVFDTFEDLSKDVQALMKEAFHARDTAYAPYSQFYVGAAILLDNGEVVPGSNQENASYPSGLCAERTAIYFAGAKYPTAKIQKIAISAKSIKHPVESPIAPCGACRQAIAEYEVKQESPIEIYFMGETGKVVRSNSLKELLPLMFDNSYL